MNTAWRWLLIREYLRALALVRWTTWPMPQPAVQKNRSTWTNWYSRHVIADQANNTKSKACNRGLLITSESRFGCICFCFEDVFTGNSSAPFLPLFFRRLTLSDSAASLRWLPSPRWLPHQPPFPVYDVLPSQLPASVSLGTLRIAMALPSRTTMWKSETEELYPLTMHRPHLMSITWLPTPLTGLITG